MSGDEPLAEVDVVVLTQSGADRGVLKDLGVARSHRSDQHFARLPDCEHCEIIALLLCHGITQVDIAVDNSENMFLTVEGSSPSCAMRSNVKRPNLAKSRHSFVGARWRPKILRTAWSGV